MPSFTDVDSESDAEGCVCTPERDELCGSFLLLAAGFPAFSQSSSATYGHSIYVTKEYISGALYSIRDLCGYVIIILSWTSQHHTYSINFTGLRDQAGTARWVCVGILTDV